MITSHQQQQQHAPAQVLQILLIYSAASSGDPHFKQIPPAYSQDAWQQQNPF